MLPGPLALGCHCGNMLGPWGWEQRGVALGEGGGQASLGGRQALPAPLPMLCLLPALPRSQPVQKSLLCCWVFSPLLIPNQEIKGRQRLRLFPLCRELESSGRGDRPFPDRPRGGGHAPQVEGPGWGNTLGAAVGGPRGIAGMKAHWVLKGNSAGVARGLRAPTGGWEAICSRGGGGRLRRMGWPA